MKTMFHLHYLKNNFNILPIFMRSFRIWALTDIQYTIPFSNSSADLMVFTDFSFPFFKKNYRLTIVIIFVTFILHNSFKNTFYKLLFYGTLVYNPKWSTRLSRSRFCTISTILSFVKKNVSYTCTHNCYILWNN